MLTAYIPPLTSHLLLLTLLGCHRTTSTLTPELEQRFQQEGILHRADDQVFRYTENAGATWENRDASIIVTRTTVFIHKNEKVGVEITPATRRHCEVHRDHDRVVIKLGEGRSADSWSFRPTDDAEAWTRDIRSVIKAE